MKFYLGTPPVEFVATAGVPTLVSLGYLRPDTPAATAPYVLDSGGFAELGKHGRWRTTPAEHVERVRAAIEQLGEPDFVGQQDWTCGPPSLKATGLTVGAHQERTVLNFLELRQLAPEVPWLPTLQGWTHGDYDRHVALFEAAGVDLPREPLVGVGSIANRQHDPEVGRIMRDLAVDLKLHGFGVKKTGLAMYGSALAAADSASWSIDARYLRGKLGARPSRSCDECEAEYQAGTHSATCARCLRYALRWRAEALVLLEQAVREDQGALFVPDDRYTGPARTPRATFTDMGSLPESQQIEMEAE